MDVFLIVFVIYTGHLILLGWTGHVPTGDTGFIQHFGGEITGKTSTWKSEKKMRDTIRMGLMEVGCEDGRCVELG
jgi:hypothetical protein